VLPPVEQVRPGLWSIQVPTPDSPLRYVPVSAFEHAGDFSIVDAGWNTDAAWRSLIDGLAVAGASVTDVTAVLVTHIHPDNHGLAGRVREASGAWIGLRPADAALAGDRHLDLGSLKAGMHEVFRDCGVPDEVSAETASSSVPLGAWVQSVVPDRLFEDGERIEMPGWDLRAVRTPGHSPGDLCFVEPGRRLLLTGDCVLPRISPNVSWHAQSDPNPLADFLESLDRLRGFNPDLVLPAHEYRFADLHGRLRALVAHHRQRLAEILTVVTARLVATCWDRHRVLELVAAVGGDHAVHALRRDTRPPGAARPRRPDGEHPRDAHPVGSGSGCHGATGRHRDADSRRCPGLLSLTRPAGCVPGAGRRTNGVEGDGHARSGRSGGHRHGCRARAGAQPCSAAGGWGSARAGQRSGGGSRGRVR